MKQLFDILHPVPETLRKSGEGKSLSVFANVVEYLSSDSTLETAEIALIGVKNANSGNTDFVRKALYNLYLPHNCAKIIDLGDVDENELDKLRDVHTALTDKNVFVIVFGGSTDGVMACYKALESKSDFLTVTCVAPSIILGNNYLSHLFDHKASTLFNLNVIGYQNYLSEAESIKELNDNYFNAMRLASFRENTKEVEPVLRDSHALVIDMSAVRACDAPGANRHEPNGLYAEEICLLAMYAGISDNMKTAGLFGFDSSLENTQTSILTAQIIWHLIDGFARRRHENLLNNANGIKKFLINLDSPLHDLVFYHSETSERWWMEVKISGDATAYIIACSENDYKSARRHEIPLRWLWYHQKLVNRIKIY
ncbi:MAG: hypothetical protein LBC98_09455 [Prevotellaceae bacterium]|jgi:formiminoglutamase|nr:hypothetical protein [Prevotellaceae bacterium]